MLSAQRLKRPYCISSKPVFKVPHSSAGRCRGPWRSGPRPFPKQSPGSRWCHHGGAFRQDLALRSNPVDILGSGLDVVLSLITLQWPSNRATEHHGVVPEESGGPGKILRRALPSGVLFLEFSGTTRRHFPAKGKVWRDLSSLTQDALPLPGRTFTGCFQYLTGESGEPAGYLVHH
jgi:hypothetical protein